MSKYGKERKVIVIPLTNQDTGNTQVFSINDYSVVFRFNEPTTLKAKIIDNIKSAVVISRAIKTEFDANTGRTQNKIKVIEKPRYKIIELSKEFKEDSEEIRDGKISDIEENIDENGTITKELLSEQTIKINH